ncbi:MAG TPA: class I SAM-dependent methyltransferase [Thermoanaerobaculia bacterium]|nr:class I SAM-dependent methyltransferase [Thermoanaerobaculia bacterium]
MRFASRYPTLFLRAYVHVKTATDPAYEAVFEVLRDSSESVLDLGCGIGALALYLRERGCSVPISGIDQDRRKVEIARAAVDGDQELCFAAGDVRAVGDFAPTVILLDVLHYLTDAEQAALLSQLAARATTVIIRDGLRDGTWRYRATFAQESLARAAGWLRVERLNFPPRESIEAPFRGTFDLDVRPMFGRMPFNNYLFVFRRSSSGTTKA